MHIKRPTPSRGTEPPDLAMRGQSSTRIDARRGHRQSTEDAEPAKACKGLQSVSAVASGEARSFEAAEADWGDRRV